MNTYFFYFLHIVHLVHFEKAKGSNICIIRNIPSVSRHKKSYNIIYSKYQEYREKESNAGDKIEKCIILWFFVFPRYYNPGSHSLWKVILIKCYHYVFLK